MLRRLAPLVLCCFLFVAGQALATPAQTIMSSGTTSWTPADVSVAPASDVATAPSAAWHDPPSTGFTIADQNHAEEANVLLQGNATIEGTVWRDTNDNGTTDSGETGMGSVELSLNGGKQTKVTASDGTYKFTHVAPGNSTVSVIVPSGYQATGQSSQMVSVPATASPDVTGKDFFLDIAP